MTTNPSALIPPLRREPAIGTYIRIPLANGLFGYACKMTLSSLWVFSFLSNRPAKGGGFFAPQDRKYSVMLGDLPNVIVNCGRSDQSKEELQQERPKFYDVPDESIKRIYGVTQDAIVWDGMSGGPRELTEEEVRSEKRYRKIWLSFDTYEALFEKWLPEMEVREVPEEFLDKKALSGEPVLAKAKPSLEVELVIVFQEADLTTDDPELDIEEPLEDALSEADCASVGGSGTVPGAFEISIDTVRPDLRRTLKIVRRVLKKLQVPASTQIVQIGEPNIEHPLEEPEPVPKVKKKAARKKKR